ncbi:hypothetical protein [Marinigracilibium pacificum]|uniref:Uncharacterized protein n=1 Tax=Marinigracilibium pacificum TaxID=2729599 RepID=A0A848J328_9BACT|nr:hypothetical protein [Marinigracilibium pacificum]NMM47582.1 hypothetical protein [Marinigracilibium pacificum]
MKHFPKIIFFIFICAACNSSDSSQDEIAEDTVSSVVVTKPEIDTSRPSDSIADLFSGTWISSYYLKKIEDSASVYLNKDYKSSLLGFNLKGEDLKTGDAWVIPFNTGTQTTDKPIRWNYEDSSFISLDSPSIKIIINRPGSLIYEYANGNKAYYRKTTDRESAIRGVLFEGNYISESGKKYSFSANGSITGFEDKKYFSILDNFSEELEFDAIFISDNVNRDNELIYHYEISGDTIRLYDLAGEYPEMGIGAMAHELIKTN